MPIPSGQVNYRLRLATWYSPPILVLTSCRKSAPYFLCSSYEFIEVEYNVVCSTSVLRKTESLECCKLFVSVISEKGVSWSASCRVYNVHTPFNETIFGENFNPRYYLSVGINFSPCRRICCRQNAQARRTPQLCELENSWKLDSAGGGAPRFSGVFLNQR